MERGRPAHEWGLDPAGYAAVDALRDSGRLPQVARWFSSPEEKALETARRLAGAEVAVVPELREHERHSTVWVEDFSAVVGRAFERPDVPALAGWEPLSVMHDRLLPAVRRILSDHPGEDLVLVGHGTAWTLLRAELTGRPPDLDAWARLEMPDVWVVETAVD